MWLLEVVSAFHTSSWLDYYGTGRAILGWHVVERHMFANIILRQFSERETSDDERCICKNLRDDSHAQV